jgi:ribA/ribD-fused uncharacterized protein
MNYDEINGVTVKKLKYYWKSIPNQLLVVGFYSHNSDVFPFFSNFYIHEPFKFTIPEWCGIFRGNTVDINFSEKAIMLCKASLMGDIKSYESIKKSLDPFETKNLGRKISPWNQELWDKFVCYIALEVIRSKFSQNTHFKNSLLSTGEYLIAEASPSDKIWGIGLESSNPNINKPKEWEGSNILGWALMCIRKELNK